MVGELILTRIFDFRAYPHQLVALFFDVFLIDHWSGESLLIFVDGVLAKNLTFNSSSQHFMDLCGNETYDRIESISMEFRHLRHQLNLTIAQDLRSTPQVASRSWGLNKFKMVLKVQCQSNSKLINNTYCECEEGYYRWSRGAVTLGFGSNFNYECRICPYPSVLCLNETHHLSCLPRFKLDEEKYYCELPHGKYINRRKFLIFVRKFSQKFLLTFEWKKIKYSLISSKRT